MRQLARLLLAFVVVPGLLFPQGGSYCLLRIVGLSEGARKAQCDACCCRAVKMERHDAAPLAAPASNDASRPDTCCLALPEIGGTVDSTAQSRLDLQQSLVQLATTLFFAPDDFATSVVADGRLALAPRGPPDAPRVRPVPIALPLRL